MNNLERLIIVLESGKIHCVESASDLSWNSATQRAIELIRYELRHKEDYEVNQEG